MANQLSAIKHVVQLMLENRSIDKMLGFRYEDRHVKLEKRPVSDLKTPDPPGAILRIIEQREA